MDENEINLLKEKVEDLELLVRELTTVPIYDFALTEDLVKACEGTEFKPDDFLPTKSDPEATGWDVRCAAAEGFDLTPENYLKIPLGFRAFCPSGWWAEMNPRSSTFIKMHCHALYGKVDETYENEWFFICQYIPNAGVCLNSNYPRRISFGQRIGQLIPCRRQGMTVNRVSNSNIDYNYNTRDSVRKTGGFGSTGEK